MLTSGSSSCWVAPQLQFTPPWFHSSVHHWIFFVLVAQKPMCTLEMSLYAGLNCLLQGLSGCDQFTRAAPAGFTETESEPQAHSVPGAGSDICGPHGPAPAPSGSSRAGNQAQTASEDLHKWRIHTQKSPDHKKKHLTFTW